MCKGSACMLLVAIVFFELIFPRRAWAYLDPGTGSLILQIVFAGILGAIFTFKMWWRRVIDFLREKIKS